MTYGGDGMVWQILLCALAAAGLLMLVWTVVGVLLVPFSLRSSCMVIFVGGNEARLEQQVRAFAWLTGSCFLRCRLLLVVDTQAQWELARRVCGAYSWATCVWRENLERSLQGFNEDNGSK